MVIEDAEVRLVLKAAGVADARIDKGMPTYLDKLAKVLHAGPVLPDVARIGTTKSF